MADPDDFCRTCHGSGVVRFQNGRGITIAEPCDWCGGTGHKSVKVVEKVD